MIQYQVLRIAEQDYGCEELPSGQVVCADVLLRGEDGRELTVSMPDALLYQRDIREGDTVLLDPAEGLLRSQ